jgi:hypothetical protein
MSINTSLPRRSRKALAGGAATVAVAALLAACGGSSNTTATVTPAAATSSAPSSAQGTPPGLGTTVTGAAADKAKAAALAKYPGTAERVMKLSDGSYVVHVMRTSGDEVHVKVSSAFAVTGLEQGPAGGARGGFGTPATGAAADKAQAAALAKYPGTAERVMKLSDGSYVVHVMRTSGGEVHVKVSKAFAVTGIEQGPPAGGAPPATSGSTTQS